MSYLSDNKAVKGSKEFATEMNGVTYLFASAAHKNLFKSNQAYYNKQTKYK